MTCRKGSYVVAWTADHDPQTGMKIGGLPTCGTLRRVRQLARKFGIGAVLYDNPGFTRGWVHSDGDYRIR